MIGIVGYTLSSFVVRPNGKVCYCLTAKAWTRFIAVHQIVRNNCLSLHQSLAFVVRESLNSSFC